MSVYVPLKKAFEQSRFQEVIGGVVSAYNSQPLNELEIIQLGELALEAMQRDHASRDQKLIILRRLAASYSAVNRHAKAKVIYRKILIEDDCWEDLYGLIKSLASEGEIENLRIQLQESLPKKIQQKNVVQLEQIAKLLHDFNLLKKVESEIRLNISIIEGDIESVIKTKDKRSYTNDFIKDAPWEESIEAVEEISGHLTNDEKHRRLFIKKIYEAFMIHGTNQALLQEVVKYFIRTDSTHIGYFLKENSGLKVELPEIAWIDSAFKRSLSVEPPEEIDVEIDLGEDLFAEEERSLFEQIKTLENRISFLLNQNKKDDAKRLEKELRRLDPSNQKFENVFGNKPSLEKSDALKSSWDAVISTLAEIDSYVGKKVDSKPAMTFSWKSISRPELVKNYRDYSVALIQAREFEACIELLEKVLEMSVEAFKDGSYLKARCYFEIGNYNQAKVIAESLIESCVLDQNELNEALYLCAESLEHLGKVKEALRVYKKILESNENYRLTKYKISLLEQR
ncbi:MAG: hypothetical protein CME71_05600 [Halobacteriovorax sp.]|nr:hypothetical protein [Halobacteriovorax sp.]